MRKTRYGLLLLDILSFLFSQYLFPSSSLFLVPGIQEFVKLSEEIKTGVMATAAVEAGAATVGALVATHALDVTGILFSSMKNSLLLLKHFEFLPFYLFLVALFIPCCHSWHCSPTMVGMSDHMQIPIFPPYFSPCSNPSLYLGRPRYPPCSGGLITASSLALLGLVVLPYRRQAQRAEFRRRVKALRQQMDGTLAVRLDRELGKVRGRILDCIGPYSRFVSVEENKIQELGMEVEVIDKEINKLRTRLV